MPDLLERITAVIRGQRFAVLATSGDEGPYTSLVAFAGTGSPHELVFVTPRDSVKYRNLAGNDRVSLFIDDRGNRDADLRHATGITVMGRAAEVTGPRRDGILHRYLERHGRLADFAGDAANALVLVAITRYVMVSEFSRVEVYEA